MTTESDTISSALVDPFADATHAEWLAAVRVVDAEAKRTDARLRAVKEAVKAVKRVQGTQSIHDVTFHPTYFTFKPHEIKALRLVGPEVDRYGPRVPATHVLTHLQGELNKLRAVTRLWLFGLESLKNLAEDKGWMKEVIRVG